MKRLFFLIVSGLIISACSTKEPPEPDIYSIKSIGVLSTTEFTVGKIVRFDDSPEWYKFGDRKILIRCRAKVKAGVNLMDAEIKKEENKITVKLPAPVITSFVIDPDDVQTVMVDVNGFRSKFNQTDKNEILKRGEAQILQQVESTSIYREAAENAVAFVRDFYREAGYPDVEISIEKRHEKK